jgi:predicted DNA-binding protein (UPF0251 family)
LNKLIPLATILQSYAEEYFPEICGNDLFFSLTGCPSDPMVSMGRSMASMSTSGINPTEFTLRSIGLNDSDLLTAAINPDPKPQQTKEAIKEATAECMSLYESGQWTQARLAEKYDMSESTIQSWIAKARSQKAKEGVLNPCP